MAEPLSREFDPRTKTLALVTLAKLRRRFLDDEGLVAIEDYLHHLEQSLARYAPTHMAEVWRENERLKAALAALEQQGEPEGEVQGG